MRTECGVVLTRYGLRETGSGVLAGDAETRKPGRPLPRE
ncbi:hypothetical protein BN2537_16103 [Streptomyces venezuelae]|nr:hypothetical protein BN2537_16103 [Streptomyces venezuelae]